MIPIRLTATVHADPAGLAAEYDEAFDRNKVLEYVTHDIGETLRGGLAYSAALTDVRVVAEVTDGRGPRTHSDAQVNHALNKAADDILDAVAAGADGLRDGLNLLVKAAMFYLGHGGGLHAAIRANYDDNTPDEVLSWVAACA